VNFWGGKSLLHWQKNKKEKKVGKKRILTHKMYLFKKKYSPLS
jgi:hypothetical protein